MSDEHGEPPRPDPGFRIYVVYPPTAGLMVESSTHTGKAGACRYGAGASVDVTHAVMDVYDIAINSMDFGSGFLSTEEVGNLRALGEAIGAERFDYQHDKCLRCGQPFGWHYTYRPGIESTLGIDDRRSDRDPCTGFVRPA